MVETFKKLWTLSFLISIMSFSGSIAAHGNVPLESDICVRSMSGSMVHLSTYQPQYDPEAEYCTEIPHEGETFWALDLIDHALRNSPIDIRIVRSGSNLLSDTVASIYSTDHADGIIKGEFNLTKGKYTLFVTGQGVPTLHYEFPLQVQSENFKDTFFSTVPYIIVFLLIALFTDKYLKLRQAQH